MAVFTTQSYPANAKIPEYKLKVQAPTNDQIRRNEPTENPKTMFTVEQRHRNYTQESAEYAWFPVTSYSTKEGAEDYLKRHKGDSVDYRIVEVNRRVL